MSPLRPSRGFAGPLFTYNFLFFFPAVLLSFAFWTAAIVWYVRFVRRSSSRSALNLLATPILLLPFTCQALWTALLLSTVFRNPIKSHGPDFTLQVITSIVTSLIAGLIFWLFFSYLPWRARRKKLRPIVELALYDIYGRLFSLFDAIMRGQPHSPSHYQAEIRSGKLTEEQI